MSSNFYTKALVGTNLGVQASSSVFLSVASILIIIAIMFGCNTTQVGGRVNEIIHQMTGGDYQKKNLAWIALVIIAIIIFSNLILIVVNSFLLHYLIKNNTLTETFTEIHEQHAT